MYVFSLSESPEGTINGRIFPLVWIDYAPLKDTHCMRPWTAEHSRNFLTPVFNYPHKTLRRVHHPCNEHDRAISGSLEWEEVHSGDSSTWHCLTVGNVVLPLNDEDAPEPSKKEGVQAAFLAHVGGWSFTARKATCLEGIPGRYTFWCFRFLFSQALLVNLHTYIHFIEHP